MQSLIHATDRTHLPACYPDEPEIWVVDVNHQHIHRWRKAQGWDSAPVSSSRFGLGSQPDSKCTPLGAHRVCEVIGVGAPLGQPFISRKPAGAPLPAWTGGEGDRILSRIIRLDGLIPELNHTSRERYIYIHGTQQEEKLGTPASHGCIRMANRTLAEWADELGDIRPLVWIGTLN
ncbi:MAG: L,D-transpeptidase [Kiritimatiellae bacterium]|jgi:L,D-transpeptidase YbiS|nr:L,D-transpeptidase [Kiritimatiellia bacterium]